MDITRQRPYDVCISSEDSNSGGEYEVFLSFHGEDTRKRFTDVLYTFLEAARVRTFRDSEDLHVGETIGSELVECIKQSKISIPVFSEKYASSKWCLLELVEMVKMAKCEECRNGDPHIQMCKNCNKRNGGHKIIPIFYDVSPDDVKLKTEVYGKFFAQHVDTHNPETVLQWKAALKDVGRLKGLDLKEETDGYWGKLIKKVVEKVLQKLKKSNAQLPEILVGMEQHKETLKGFLNPHSSCVRILVIHGMGGIGKTTIAKVIYNELCKSYKFCCFLENFGQKSEDPNHVVKLQSQLISDLARGRFFDICNVEKGREDIKDLIKGKKLLLVLDDMDEESQFKICFGNYISVASGSTIIVTTTNMEIIKFLKATYKIDSLFEIYEPPLMDLDQSLTLFSSIVFNSNSPPEDSAIISREIAFTAFGLPLALEYTANLFRGNQEKEKWNAKLRDIKKFPQEMVLKKLTRRFEALNKQQRHIFLDTACLFIGEDNIVSSYMWEDCGFNPENNVDANVRRSLIKLKDDNSLEMHPHLRDLGREIVRNENINQAGKRTRLWLREEALDIFDRKMGTDSVLALCLGFTKKELEYSRSDSLSIEDFGELRNLQFLRAGSIDFKGDFKRLFSNLRWLQWKPLGNSPTECELENLVILDLSESQIVDDWDGWSQIKKSKKLKVLNLSKCNNLSMAPDFSTFESLERLILASCRRLGNTEQPIVNLINLRVLNLSECTFLKGALDFSQISNLEYLDVQSCTQLTSLNGFESLLRLKYLNTSGCHNLETLPNLSHLQELKTLRTTDCKKLSMILGLDMLVSLEHLDISGCVDVKKVPNISNMKVLKEINLSRCFINIAEVGIWELESVETLDVSWCTCTSEEQILDLSNLKKLRKLNLAGFGNFNEIRGLEELKSLEQLNISGWKSIQNLPDLSNLKKLKEIKAHLCENLCEIRGLERLESLILVVITGCKSLKPLPDLPTTKIEKSH